LPEEVQQQLRAGGQPLLEDEPLSERTQAGLLATLPRPRSEVSWRARLLAAGRRHLQVPVLALPATLMAGVLLGWLLPVLLQPLPEVWRGTSVPEVEPAVPPSVSSGRVEIADAVRQQPRLWLEQIAGLLQQGRVAQAREELQAFELLYPDYTPPPSP
ncbi:MAG: hypothetical protein R3E89_18560, partial [Thiolinea sp.]